MTEEVEGTTPAPQPVAFEDMPLTDEVKRALSDMGYTHAAPVQLAVFEPATRRIDLVVQARTGTGKTAAFGLPLVDQLVKRSLEAPQALVLTPTRELALQVARELDQLAAHRGIKTVAVYGGAPIQRQIDAIRSGAQIIAGTPGRVLDHLKRRTLDPKHLKHLVLDESDEMLSMGFERELHAILEFLPEDRHTMLFSATMPPDIVRIAANRLHDPQFLSLSGDQVGALDILHFVYVIPQNKADALVRIVEVEDPESAIVFCNTRDETERVSAALSRAGYDADWLNGDLAQSEREEVMRRSKEGKLRFLVATDVAARGIDISHLTHVINYDFPETAEAYVHRTGRTGRMGRTGMAVSLVAPQDIGNLYFLRLTYKIRPIEKQIPTAGELKTRAEADLIEMVAQASAIQEPHPDDLALARRLLTHDRCEAIVAGLLRNHLGDRPRAEELAAASRRARPPRPAEELGEHRLGGDGLGRTLRGRHRAGTKPRLRNADSTPLAPAAPMPRPPAPEPPARVAEPAKKPEESPRVAPPAATNDRNAPPQGLTRLRERTRTRERRDTDADLPRYEMSPVSSVDLDNARAPVEPRAPAAPRSLADWQPPQEDNDDQPILGGESQRGSNGEGAFDNAIGPEDQVELFVNVGRRDGVRSGDLVRALSAREGIDKSDVGSIRLRERNAFVIVRKQVVDLALAALNGARIGNRTASAEVARPRDPSGTPE